MTDVDVKRLREAAQAAESDHERAVKALRVCVEFYVLHWYERKDGEDSRLDLDGPVAKLLALVEAASPSAVIGLLDEIERLERAAERAVREGFELAVDMAEICDESTCEHDRDGSHLNWTAARIELEAHLDELRKDINSV